MEIEGMPFSLRAFSMRPVMTFVVWVRSNSEALGCVSAAAMAEPVKIAPR